MCSYIMSYSYIYLWKHMYNKYIYMYSVKGACTCTLHVYNHCRVHQGPELGSSCFIWIYHKTKTTYANIGWSSGIITSEHREKSKSTVLRKFIFSWEGWEENSYLQEWCCFIQLFFSYMNIFSIYKFTFIIAYDWLIDWLIDWLFDCLVFNVLYYFLCQNFYIWLVCKTNRVRAWGRLSIFTVWQGHPCL